MGERFGDRNRLWLVAQQRCALRSSDAHARSKTEIGSKKQPHASQNPAQSYKAEDWHHNFYRSPMPRLAAALLTWSPLDLSPVSPSSKRFPACERKSRV